MDDLIYNQSEIPKDQWRYGLRSSAATGCGWIATYNALRLLGYRAEPEQLIRFYERQVPLLHGNLGTLALAPALFFQKQGFQVETLSVTARFDEAAKAADACVLFYYWRSKWRLGAHFVAVQYSGGQFFGYNTFRTSRGADCYGASLEGFLRRQHFFAPVLITLHR